MSTRTKKILAFSTILCVIGILVLMAAIDEHRGINMLLGFATAILVYCIWGVVGLAVDNWETKQKDKKNDT